MCSLVRCAAEGKYTLENIPELTSGVCFVVTGTVLSNCDRFEVNLLLKNSDIAFHFNPRFGSNNIVYNSLKLNCGWENEEYGSLIESNLQREKPFTLHILVTNESFLISVNGRYCHEFRHRRPFQEICKLEVKGDVDDVVVDHLSSQPTNLVPRRTTEEQRKEEPIQLEGPNAKQIPYTGVLQVPFTNGQKLHVIGRLNAHPSRFHVNLQTSAYTWPQQNILFHLNPRFQGERLIVCNNWNSGWQNEERSIMPCDLQPCKKFCIRIDCTDDCYKVMLNGSPVLEFMFRDKPELVNAVNVGGDIELYDVAVETTSSCCGC